MDYTISRKVPSGEDLKQLLESVGWASHLTADELRKAFETVPHLVAFYDLDKLIAIARSMDDNIWSANIDCVVVHPDYHNHGLGSNIVRELLKDIGHIKCISVSVNERMHSRLYINLGFNPINDGLLLQIEKP